MKLTFFFFSEKEIGHQQADDLLRQQHRKLAK